jgi:hypothetical protein
MAIEITFTLEVGLEPDTTNGMRATLYLKGAESNISALTFEQVGQEIVDNDRVTFSIEPQDGLMLRLDDNSLGRVLFRSWTLPVDDFEESSENSGLWSMNIRIRKLFELTYSVDTLREWLPETPFIVDLTSQGINGTEGLRITSLALNQLSDVFELTGTGQSLATYDPTSGISTVGFPFDFMHRFRVRAFHGLPLFDRIVAVDTLQTVLTPTAQGIGSTIINVVTSILLSFSQDDITRAWDSNIQARIDDAVEGISPDQDVRTITLPEVVTIPNGGGISFTPLVWLPSLPEETPTDEEESDGSDKSLPLPAGCLSLLLKLLTHLKRTLNVRERTRV